MDLQALRHLAGVGVGLPIPLIRKRMVIGRLDSCDIVLKFPDVSDKHCELTYVDGQWLIRDLQTVNGIRINGSEVTQAQTLRPGDQIAIAGEIFIYE